MTHRRERHGFTSVHVWGFLTALFLSLFSAEMTSDIASIYDIYSQPVGKVRNEGGRVPLYMSVAVLWDVRGRGGIFCFFDSIHVE